MINYREEPIFNTPEINCPSCNHKLDSVAGQDVRPEPEDYTICIYCLAVLQFNKDLSVQLIEEKDIPKLVQSERKRFKQMKEQYDRMHRHGMN